MSQNIKCEVCGNWTIELIGDEELPCKCCSEIYQELEDLK